MAGELERPIKLTEDQTVTLNMLYQEERVTDVEIVDQDQIGNLLVAYKRWKRGSVAFHPRRCQINTIGELHPREGVPHG